MKMTIKFVKDEPRPWDARDGGQMHSIEGGFEDGSAFAINCKPENSEARIATLKELIGQEGEFGLEAKADYKGVRQWKLTEWPGKQQRPAYGGGGGSGVSSGGGGKAPYQPRYRDTPEGTRSEQDSIHRSVALTQAVACLTSAVSPGQSPDQAGWVIKTADRFYDWLSQGQPLVPVQAPEASSGPPTQPQSTIGSYEPMKDQKEFFGQPAKSQACQKYLEEIEKAVKAKDSGRLSKLRAMMVDSVQRKTLTIQEVDSFLEPAIIQAEKALQSAANYDAWYQAKVQEQQSDIVPF